MAVCKAGLGDTVTFWTDNRLGVPLIQQYPELHSFALNDKISLAAMKDSHDLIEEFHMPLYTIAFSQLTDLAEKVVQPSKLTLMWTDGLTFGRQNSMQLAKCIST